MLKDSQAFSGFSVDDLEQAQRFYAETLGVQTSMDEQGLALRIPGRNPVFIYPKDNHEPATFTVLNFPVADIETTVEALTAAGVAFEHYGAEMQQDEKGISRYPGGPAIAWFKDPAGNILSVIQQG